MAATPLYQSGVQNSGTLAGTEFVDIDNGGAVKTRATVAQIAAVASSNTGTVTVNGATPVAKADTRVTANSVIVFTLNAIGGTPAGAPFVTSITPGASFSVEAGSTDTSTYNYVIFN